MSDRVRCRRDRGTAEPVKARGEKIPRLDLIEGKKNKCVLSAGRKKKKRREAQDPLSLSLSLLFFSAFAFLSFVLFVFGFPLFYTPHCVVVVTAAAAAVNDGGRAVNWGRWGMGGKRGGTQRSGTTARPPSFGPASKTKGTANRNKERARAHPRKEKEKNERAHLPCRRPTRLRREARAWGPHRRRHCRPWKKRPH